MNEQHADTVEATGQDSIECTNTLAATASTVECAHNALLSSRELSFTGRSLDGILYQAV
jgi:hypothetical protein